jgi:elongation factor P--(R)-beta-lysine ligase
LSPLEKRVEYIRLRQLVYSLTRDFFSAGGYLEVETPILEPHGSLEAYIDPFTSTLISPDEKKKDTLYLSVSPENSMKKLLAADLSRIFEIKKCFRNREDLSSKHHSPEFTMLEWYRKGADYKNIMTEMRDLITVITERFGIRIALSDWQTITVKEAFLKYASVDFDGYSSWDDLISTAKSKGYPAANLDDAFYLIFLNEVEPHLGKEHPLFLIDYPTFQAAFAVKKPDRKYAERFELYWRGMELANGYTELIDPKEQVQRYKENTVIRKANGLSIHPHDKAMISSLSNIGLCGGVALGLDRLLMTLTLAPSIQDVLAFPLSEMLES